MFVFVVCGPRAGTDNNCGYVDIDGNRQFDWTYALVVHDLGPQKQHLCGYDIVTVEGRTINYHAE